MSDEYPLRDLDDDGLTRLMARRILHWKLYVEPDRRDGIVMVWRDSYGYQRSPHPISLPFFIGEMEKKIAEYNLQPEYMAALERIVGADVTTYSGRFDLLRATPEQRRNAALAATGVPV